MKIYILVWSFDDGSKPELYLNTDEDDVISKAQVWAEAKTAFDNVSVFCWDSVESEARLIARF